MVSKKIARLLAQHYHLSIWVVLLLPTLIALGIWQLDRAAQKRQLLQDYARWQQQPPLELGSVAPETLRPYQPVTVSGSLDPERYWLLDNRSLAGQPGYEVIMPLALGDDSATAHTTLLVNRGWVAAPRLRHELPRFDTPAGRVYLQGYLYPLPRNAIFSQSQSDMVFTWPKRVLQLEHQVVQQALQTSTYALLLRLNSTSLAALDIHWSITNSDPQRHRAYALQWFALAAALLLLYLGFIGRSYKNA